MIVWARRAGALGRDAVIRSTRNSRQLPRPRSNATRYQSPCPVTIRSGSTALPGGCVAAAVVEGHELVGAAGRGQRGEHARVEPRGAAAEVHVIQSAAPIDPTITVAGTYLLYGSISRLLEALFLVALGHAVLGTGVLPRWAGRSAYLLALVNLAFVPSLYFGTSRRTSTRPTGGAPPASVGGLFMLWLLAAAGERYPSNDSTRGPWSPDVETTALPNVIGGGGIVTEE
jgi:hypothetical protein